MGNYGNNVNRDGQDRQDKPEAEYPTDEGKAKQGLPAVDVNGQEKQ